MGSGQEIKLNLSPCVVTLSLLTIVDNGSVDIYSLYFTQTIFYRFDG